MQSEWLFYQCLLLLHLFVPAEGSLAFLDYHPYALCISTLLFDIQMVFIRWDLETQARGRVLD